MSKPRVIIIGAGMAGMGAAIRLLEAGIPCTIIEAQEEVGGLARSFEIDGKHFPLGYHHILSQDKPLLAMLKKLDIYKEVSWKKGKVLFAINNKIYNLENPIEFLKFPMSLVAKIRFVILMAYCFLKKNWGKDLGNAQVWLDKIAGETVRKTIFDPLMDIKYGLPSSELSANWLGSRLHYQEFSKPLGFIPGTDWTKILNEKLSEKICALGGIIITNAVVTKINLNNDKFEGLEYAQTETSVIPASSGGGSAFGGKAGIQYDNVMDSRTLPGIFDLRGNDTTNHIAGDILINTAPPHIFLKLIHDAKASDVVFGDKPGLTSPKTTSEALAMPPYKDSQLEKIEYLDALSLILETEQKLPRELYLLSCLKPRYSFGGIFMLSSLNKTIGIQNGTVINFFTTLSAGSEYLRYKSADELLEIYSRDFEKLFRFSSFGGSTSGGKLKPIWHHLTLIKNYSPKFLNGYENSAIQGSIKNIYFAGNYLTYPIITSTGSALESGERTADMIIDQIF